MERRDFFKLGITTSLVGLLQKSLLAGANCAKQLSIRRSGEQTMICQGEYVLIEYCTSFMLKSPCFTSIAGPATGQSLISTIQQPWRQTSGVSFTCDRVYCNDANTDAHFGCGPRQLGQITSLDLSIGPCSETTAEFRDYCEWRRPEHRPIISDVRRFRISRISETAYILDCEYTLSPLADLKVRPSGQSFFSLRAAEDLAVSGGGQLLNSFNAKGQRNTHETSDGQSSWFTFSSKRGEPVEGIAVLRPANVVPGSRWLTRDYGLLVPNSFHYLDTAWHLYKGNSYRFAYRIVAFSGQPDPVMLNGLYDDEVRCKRTRVSDARLHGDNS